MFNFYDKVVTTVCKHLVMYVFIYVVVSSYKNGLLDTISRVLY